MGSRLKEDERNERAIRNLLKLPANKKCINCNSLGPQYVCTNFWTFVCTTCSGIHREFTHRVKSVSMAKFTSQEVDSLQNGGNERAKSIYFKEWDTQRNSLPNNSNIERLRVFIRHVYIDRRFSGERGSEKLPRGGDSYENRSDAFRSGSRSPPYEDSYDRRRNDRPSPGGRSDDSYSKNDDRSPGHDRESRYSSDQGRSPNRPVIVNDWRREDRFSNASKPEDRRTSDGDSWSDGRSPDHQKDTNMPSPPVVRPVSDILGDKVIPLKIGPPKSNGIMSADAPAHVVRNASSSSFGSSEGNQVERKTTTLGSLIDFDADFQPPAVTAPKPQAEQTNSLSATVEPTSAISNDNWASFDSATEAKLPQVESTVSNSLDSLLTQLTAPSSVPPQSGPFLTHGGGIKPDVLAGPVHVPPFNAEGFSSAPISTSIAFDSMSLPGSSGLQYQQQPNRLSSSGQISQSIQPPSNFPAAHHPLSIPKTSQEVTSVFEKQTQKAERSSNGRSALPEDLFAATYHLPLTAQGWHTSHPAGIGFTMHYSVPAPTHIFQQPQPSRLSNPFDFSNESSLSFPSMAPLHSALPTMSNPPPGLMHTPNVAASSPAYMQPPVSSYTSQISPSYADGIVSGASYLGQQGVVGAGDSSFNGSAHANQVMGGGFPPPDASNSFPGGNPFG